MESSKQTNETKNCVLETMILEEFSRKTLVEKFQKLKNVLWAGDVEGSWFWFWIFYWL